MHVHDCIGITASAATLHERGCIGDAAYMRYYVLMHMYGHGHVWVWAMNAAYVTHMRCCVGDALLKFIYSKKATKFCEIFNLRMSYVLQVKSKVNILQNFVAFSEYTNFKDRHGKRSEKL